MKFLVREKFRNRVNFVIILEFKYRTEFEIQDNQYYRMNYSFICDIWILDELLEV